MFLFNEAEVGSITEPPEKDEGIELISVKEYKRKKKRKSVFPSGLPIKKEIHDLPEEEKKCSCCENELPYIGDDVTKEIDIIPEQIRIIEHHQKKYGPCDCEGSKKEEVPNTVGINNDNIEIITTIFFI